MRIVFAGTPEFAASHLQHLIESNHQILSVWTQPDKPGKRGKKPQHSPVKALALKNNLPVYQPFRFDSQALSQLADLQPDIMIVVAFGQILPAAALEIPRHGCINVHASVLPRWRGAAPIQRAIQAGDTSTGITIMQMDAGLDTGDILAVTSCKLSPAETSASLFNRLSLMGPDILVRTLDAAERGTLSPVPQVEKEVTYATKISKHEAQIEWDTPAEEICRNVRMLNPSPTAYTWLDDLRVKVWLAETGTMTRPLDAIDGQILDLSREALGVACKDSVLMITELQLPLGKGKVLTASDLYNSRRELLAPGTIFRSRAL